MLGKREKFTVLSHGQGFQSDMSQCEWPCRTFVSITAVFGFSFDMFECFFNVLFFKMFSNFVQYNSFLITSKAYKEVLAIQ